MSRRWWKWVVVGTLALALSGCASMGSNGSAGEQCNPRLMDCGTPLPLEKTPGCSTLIMDEARAELIDPADRHREPVYRACDGITEPVVDNMIQKTIGEIAEHENDQG
ncbi:hypothetical protein [Streptomyces sp. SLBN-31]|uniref:hypothetical protein n=1 Tax=Streptomyces sp. SLBN-31 TaxID=2768444 RepID=UPI00115123B0|nr:hypothetical protein [Streptomyces sp. SLBN-31]TQJ91215.1 hypothetical protein FBY22_2019 [Streptomyces sp. SLBN-31]